MPRLFSYLDYRQLLKDRFADRKRRERRVTHRSLAQQAGFASPNFLQLVMDGKRNLTSQSIPKVCRAFGFNEKESEFFSELVAFNQAKSIADKDLAYEKLKNLRQDLPLRRVEHSQFEYFDQWYVVAIRELVALKDFREDPEWIRSRLQGKVTVAQVRRSLKLLERLGFVERSANDRLKPRDVTLTTGDEVANLGIYHYHSGMIEKAGEALKQTDPEHRDISSVTVSVSEPQYRAIKARIQAFRKEMLALAESGDQADAVYQMNIQLFPLSEILWER